MDSALRDLATMVNIVCSVMPRIRQEDLQPGTTGVDVSIADPLCDSLLSLMLGLLRHRCFLRGRVFVDVLVALFGVARELVAWVDGRLRTVASGDAALPAASEWGRAKLTAVAEVCAIETGTLLLHVLQGMCVVVCAARELCWGVCSKRSVLWCVQQEK